MKAAPVRKLFEVFLCSAPEDEHFRDEYKLLLESLTPNNFSIWHEGLIDLGDSIELTINQHLKSAGLILFLITPNFTRSEHYQKIVRDALEQHRLRDAALVSILLQPVDDLHKERFMKMQVLPTDHRPLSSRPDKEKAKEDMRKHLEKILLLMFIHYFYEIRQFGNSPTDYEIKRLGMKSTKYEIKLLEQEIKDCDKAIRDNPGNPNKAALYVKKGLALRKLGLSREAIKALETAKQLRPKDPIIYLNLGWAQYEQNQPKKAILALDEATKLSPGSISALWIKSKAHYKLGEFEQANAVADQVVNQVSNLNLNTLTPVIDELLIIKDRAQRALRERGTASKPLYRLPSEESIFTAGYADRSESQTEENQRRKVLILLGLVGLGIGGGLGWLGLQALLQRQSPPVPLHPTPTPLHTTPTPHPARWGELLLTHSYSQSVNAVAWSPDGQSIASGYNDGLVQVWKVADGSPICSYRGHTQPVWWVAWSPDGSMIASASWDKTVQVWKAASGTPLFTYRGHSHEVRTVAWSSDRSNKIASGGFDNTAQIWQLGNEKPLLTYKMHTRSVAVVAWSPDNRYIASGSNDKTVRVWDAIEGRDKFAAYTKHTNWVGTVAWSPDGKRIVSGSVDWTVHVWDATNGQDAYSYSHGDQVWKVGWSPDGNKIASGSYDKTVQVRNAASNTLLYTYRGHNAGVFTIAWSPDSRSIASGYEDGLIHIWTVGPG